MVPEELVLRFFALNDRLPTYRPPLRQFVNEYMRSRRARALDQEEKDLFVDCVGASLEVFGPNAFSVPDRTGAIHNTINKALFDAVMISIAMADRAELRARGQDLATFIPDLLADDDFRGTLGRATADRKRVFARIRAVSLKLREQEILSQALSIVGESDGE